MGPPGAHRIEGGKPWGTAMIMIWELSAAVRPD